MVGSHCTGPGPRQGQGTGNDGFLYYRPQQQLLKGSVFAPVCQSFCSGGVHGRGCAWQGSVCAWQGEGMCMTGGGAVVAEGACVAGGHAWPGRAWWGEGCVAGEACMAGGVCGRRDGHCSRQYASYWNAFLLHYVLYTLHSDRDRDGEPLFSIVPIPVPVPVPCSVYEPLHSFFFYNLLQTCSILPSDTH